MTIPLAKDLLWGPEFIPLIENKQIFYIPWGHILKPAPIVTIRSLHTKFAHVNPRSLIDAINFNQSNIGIDFIFTSCSWHWKAGRTKGGRQFTKSSKPNAASLSHLIVESPMIASNSINDPNARHRSSN